MKYYLLLILFSVSGLSQEFTYNGVVTDQQGALPGAIICIKNKSNCVSSGFDGTYAIKVKRGDFLVISFLGMKTKEIIVDDSFLSINKISDKKIQEVTKIENNDFLTLIKSSSDSTAVSKPTGIFYKYDLRYYENNGNNFQNDFSNIRSIKKYKNQKYHIKYDDSYTKIFVELNSESIFSTVLRTSEFQSTFAQGRSSNGVATYQSPETNEIFSWGPNVSTLEYSNNQTPYYPDGAIVSKGIGNGNPVSLFSANSFYNNTYDLKTGLTAKLVTKQNDYVKFNLNYNQGSIIIANTKNTEISAGIKVFKNLNKSKTIGAQISYNEFKNNLTNSNFAINKIIFANAITPIHFDNKVSSLLPNGEQRSFSNLANNPYYLMHFKQDENKSDNLSFDVNYGYDYEGNSFKSNLVAQKSTIENTNGALPFTVNNLTATFNVRRENYTYLSFSNVFKHNFKNETFVESKLNYQYQKRDLQRDFYSGFSSVFQFPHDGILSNQINKLQNRHEMLFNVSGSFEIEEVISYNDDLVLKATSELQYSSSLKKRFLNNYNISADLNNFLNSRISIYSKYSFTEIEPALQNNNLNFNSLQYQMSDFNNVNNNQELFTTSQNAATTEKQIVVGVKHNYYRPFNFNVECYYKKVNDLYAPILSGNIFSWMPAVDFYQKGIEIEIEKSLGNYYNRMVYTFNLNFSAYRNKVTAIKTTQKSIAIAGFSDVSKNYIEGQPLGVIVGSGFLRNDNNEIVIDADGFPIKDPNQKIIGDPNPDFVLGFDNKFKYKKFALSLTFDWHQGGELWNGTQQALNFYGKSKETEVARGTTNYVFEGVNQNGQVNTKPVDFYNTSLPIDQNRWVRYGIEGLSEENIEDASYFRLNNISFSYENTIKDNAIKYKISLFTNNVFIISKSKAAFIGNSLFNSAETTGLDYFNSPLMSSTGVSFNINF